MRTGLILVTIAVVLGVGGWIAFSKEHSVNEAPIPADADNLKTATFGAGCFWCVEAVFQRLRGVVSVESGYEGGELDAPTYQDICTGKTGHAEVIRIQYDPTQIKFESLLEVFFKTHDPTTRNRQGADVGTQYRSVIFFHDADQEASAKKTKAALDASGVWDDPIVTEITPNETFFKAETYHQNYFNDNTQAGYCRAVIVPKLEKLERTFKDLLKE